VALDIKKMDYLALDDRHSSSGGRLSIIISFYAINNLFLIETATTGSKSVAEGREQQVDPVLPLILSHPENNTTPDASVPLSPEELAGKGL
jgi:UDP-glucose:glycoprotein glucosyltransferase